MLAMQHPGPSARSGRSTSRKQPAWGIGRAGCLGLLAALGCTLAHGQDTLRIDTRDLPPDIVYQLITPNDSVVVTPTDGQIVVPITDTTAGTYQLSAASASPDNDVTIQFIHGASGIQDVTVLTNDTTAPLDSAMFDLHGPSTILLYDQPERRPEPAVQPYRLLLKDGMLMTPNGDGDHDELSVVANVPVTGYALTIIDKWGHQVFHSTDHAEAWNGRKDNTGEALPTGVYRYTLLFNGNTDNGKFLLER